MSGVWRARTRSGATTRLIWATAVAAVSPRPTNGSRDTSTNPDGAGRRAACGTWDGMCRRTSACGNRSRKVYIDIYM